jgi:tRNA (guanine-N7-)-methyltransferase
MNAPARTHKLSALQLPWPTPWATLFGCVRPLILEIGFGTGTFLEFLGQHHPDHNVVGLEVSNQCLMKGERLIAQRVWDHVRVVHSRAETALAHLFEPESLSAVYINYPDPWFKNDHRHRRLMQQDTLDLIVSRMRPGAILELATDIVAYAEMSSALLESHSGLQNAWSQQWLHQVEGRPITKYEAKARREGRPSYYLRYHRNSAPVASIPVLRELPMPHVVFSSPLSLGDIRARFEPFALRDGDINVGVRDVYEGRNRLLFEIHASEPTIDQHAALILAPHGAETGEYTLQLSTVGHARATAGIHTAVRGVADWIIRLDESSRVLNQKLADRD